jgi:hypothetical protein
VLKKASSQAFALQCSLVDNDDQALAWPLAFVILQLNIVR